MEMPAYPFIPKSNRYLEVGQFWALPLSDGRYGCGRVMAVPAFGSKDRIGFVAGLDGLVAIDPDDYRVGSVHRVWGWQTIVNKAELLAEE